jgi:hypothetical protein
MKGGESRSRSLTNQVLWVEEVGQLPLEVMADRGQVRDAFVWHPASPECGGPGSREYAERKARHRPTAASRRMSTT